MSDLEPWWEEAIPHKDVRTGVLPESVFAIDLGAVINENAPNVYQDPGSFYEKTHVTQVIKKMVQLTVENVGGAPSGNRIQRLQTGFGGGKTHTLLAIYHLINSPEKIQDIDKIQAIVDDSAVESIPDAEIAVIVGTDLDTSGGRSVDGLQINTPWGELAYQLGGKEAYEIIETSDKKRTSPGKEKIAQVLREASPAVILVDEFLQYVIRAQGVEVGQSTLGEQTISFIDELVKAVGTVENVFSLLSLQASERFEMFGDADRAEQLLNQIESKVERVDTETRPIQKSEIYNIARQRIFETLGDAEEHEKTAKAYFDYYRSNSSDFPDHVQEPEYRSRIVEAYPFHPEFIDTLYQQWGSMPDFQRTRGVLRFLAKVVADQYNEKPPTPLIQPGQLNMANEEVRDESLGYLEGGWDSVIDSDIAGDDSKAESIDRQMGGVYHTKSVTRSLAAALFLYSQGGGQQTGAALERLRLGVLQPGMDTPLVADAVSKCENLFFFLHEDDGFYRFTKTPNLNQVVSDYESNVDDDEKIREIREAFVDVLGESNFSTHVWPNESGDVPDDHELRLAILHPDQPLDSGAMDTMDDVREIWENHKEEFRSYRNSVVFLAADEATVSEIRGAATTKVALREIRGSQSMMSDFNESQIEEIKQRVSHAERDVPAKIRKTYSQAVVPQQSGLKQMKLDSSVHSSETGLDELLQEKLKEKDILLDRLDPNLIASDYWNIWPTSEDEDGNEGKAPHISVIQLWEHFGQLTQLPLLESEKVLKHCIARGVDEEGVIGYARITEEGYEDVRFQETFNPSDVDISDEYVIIREVVARKLIQEDVESEGASSGPGVSIGQGSGGFVGGLDQVPDSSGTDGDDVSEGPDAGVRDIEIEAIPEWEDQWDETYDAIIVPLARLGADMDVQVVVRASSDDGISKSELERQIEENLTQRNIQHEIRFEEEEGEDEELVKE